MNSLIYQTGKSSLTQILPQNFPKDAKPILTSLIETTKYHGLNLIYGILDNVVFISSPYYSEDAHTFDYMSWSKLPISYRYSNKSYVVSSNIHTTQNPDIKKFIFISAYKHIIHLFIFDRFLNPIHPMSPAEIQYILSSKYQHLNITSLQENLLPSESNSSITLPKNSNQNKFQQPTYLGVYAILTIQYKNNLSNLLLLENAHNFDKSLFHSNYNLILLDQKSNRNRFNIIRSAIQKNCSTLNFEKNKTYKITDILYVNHEFLYSSLEEYRQLNCTSTVFPITVYNGTNHCIQNHHPMQLYTAIVKAENEQGKAFLKVIRCLKCKKFFITSQAIEAQGGYNKLAIRLEFDPSCKPSDYETIGLCNKDTMSGFASSTQFHDDGYTTTKNEFERQQVLIGFMDSGLHSKEECLTYLQKFIACHLYGENATQKAIRDYNFVLNYEAQNDPIIRGELKRKK